jgi:hypothetical protein
MSDIDKKLEPMGNKNFERRQTGAGLSKKVYERRSKGLPGQPDTMLCNDIMEEAAKKLEINGKKNKTTESKLNHMLDRKGMRLQYKRGITKVDPMDKRKKDQNAREKINQQLIDA